MKKGLIGLLILSTLSVALIGCKSKEGNEVNENRVEDVNDVNENTDVNDEAEVNTESVENSEVISNENQDSNSVQNEENESSSLGEDTETSGHTSDAERYKVKLNRIKDEIDNNNFSEAEVYEKWDAALTEIYGVLQEKLTAEEAEKLTEDELAWIDYKQDSSSHYSGPAVGEERENKIYERSADITIVRCYELVDKYMK